VHRQIVFIAYEVLWFPYRRRITSIFELTRSDRRNYKDWSSVAREWGSVEITTTDRLESVLADRRLKWVSGLTSPTRSNQSWPHEEAERILQG
jgi:hypothetical protein